MTKIINCDTAILIVVGRLTIKKAMSQQCYQGKEAQQHGRGALDG